MTSQSLIVDQLSPIDGPERARLLALPGTAEAALQANAETPSLLQIEVGGTASSPELRENTLRVAAWNIQQGHELDTAANILLKHQIDVALLSECDIGVWRTGFKHAPKEIAEPLGAAYAFAVEFGELYQGEDADASQAAGFHGNAVISRYPILDAKLVRLDNAADWFISPRTKRRRVGERVAVFATLLVDGKEIIAAAAHLESDSQVEGRAAQSRTLFKELEAYANGRPVVLGGDFNAGAALEGFDFRKERLFDIAQEHGFSWQECNCEGGTTRDCRKYGGIYREGAHLDWLFVKGLHAQNSAIHPSVDEAGEAISDHEMIQTEIILK
ncbi:hypothetical protein E1162_12895 [Rhodobacteraceae bacterium RKSG542]|uniref:endonuclease/exonuclease/phosphatase family protein n=1 Tax=Pseudovibrio flavus TaxID=2529854 RepID=UPI0012BC5C18|nr:endonuclease/exonuclease/phosphatase family protein [Pseudovibrio flavus]MTI18137.1 hypothetical protein [Pseudovibrio flavus]